MSDTRGVSETRPVVDWAERERLSRERRQGSHFTFFLDDVGSRTLLRKPLPDKIRLNEFVFGLGGVIVRSDYVPEKAREVDLFLKRWSVPHLHGNKIRSAKEKFAFLRDCARQKEQFFSELEALTLDPELVVHGCIVCRPGYRDKYLNPEFDLKGQKRWEMCKTAFDISVERAAKLVSEWNGGLSVVYERAGKKEDNLLEGYFKKLKSSGTEFDLSRSSRYSPLDNFQLGSVLRTISGDGKANSLLQLADLLLHPISHRVMGLENRALINMDRKKVIIDFKSLNKDIAVKYYRFDGEYGNFLVPETHKGPEGVP